MNYKNIKDLLDLRGLIELIKNNQRSKPVCVVSTPFGNPKPAFDLDEIERQAGDLALIYVVPTGDLTIKLANELGSRVSIFNGAASVISSQWQEESDIPKRFYCNDKFRNRDTQALIDHIWKFADEKDLEKYLHIKSKPAIGILSRIMGSRGFVTLEDGGIATVRQELTTPGFPIEWAIAVGQKISGKLNETERLFLPELREETLQTLAEHYGFGNLALVLIKSAERKSGVATIYPGIDIEFGLAEISGNDLDLVTDFLSPGQVVAMRIYRDYQGRTRLKMNDIEDDETPVDAVSVVPNGPPWLVEDRDIPIETVEFDSAPDLVEPEEDVSVLDTVENPTPKPHPGIYHTPNSKPAPVLTGRTEDQWRGYAKGLEGTINGLKRELKLARDSEIAALRQNSTLNAQLRELSRNNAKSRRKSAVKDLSKSTTRSRRERWDSDIDWFHEELRRVWISRYKQKEREEKYPIDKSKFSFGPNFFQTVFDADLNEDELRKAVRVIVDIVTGRESEARQNSVHPLRESESPSAPIRSRADGATAWRANIEQKTPQARRLHFWKLPNNQIELAKIVMHDDNSI